MPYGLSITANQVIMKEYAELVDRYKRFRKINRKLHSSLFNHLPEKAINECAKKLGISKSGVFVFQEEHEMDVLMDYCIYDYYESGVNAVSRYMAEHPPVPNSDEYTVLKAMSESFYTLVQVEYVIETVGVQACDLLSNREFPLVDIGFSRTAMDGTVIAARIIPFEDFVMTSGAALPVDADVLAGILDLLTQRLDGRAEEFAGLTVEQRADLTASIIRFCLKENASSRIAYEDVERSPELISFPATSNHVGRNAPCPCGSGKKYKKCCGR